MLKSLLSLLALTSFTFAADAPPLRIGMDLSYPPFETIGADGKPSGISIEIARAFAEKLGRPLEIQNIPFTGLIPSLKSGKIDAIISSMTTTPERSKSVAFSNPYLTTGLAALIPLSSKAKSFDEIDQAGKTVIVRQGTTGETFARKNIRNARILALEKENAAVLEIIQNKADAFIYDQMSVFQNAKRHATQTRALLAPLQKEAWAIAFRKDDSELRESANSFLDEFRAKSGFDKLADKFLSEEKAAFKAQNIPFIF